MAGSARRKARGRKDQVRVRRPIPHDDPQRVAGRIAEAVDKACGAAGLGSQLEVPLTVVAGLALAHAEGPMSAAILGEAATGEPAVFGELLYDVWARFWLARPDLVAPSAPLWAWLRNKPHDSDLRGAQQVAVAARRYGLDDLAGYHAHRRGTDLLGHLLTVMRSRGARAGRGQFYTPHPVGVLMARMLDIQPGERVLEPAAGTGGLLCAAAQAMRERGLDPTEVYWYAADIDYIAVACMAVNVHLWELGPRVVLGCADTLDSRDDWIARALRERRAALQRAEIAQLLGLSYMVALVAVSGPPDGENPEGDDPEPETAGPAERDAA
jgi:hypothetical protein